MSIENIRIKTDIDNLVHLYAYPEQSLTLCGLEALGDERLDIKAGVITNRKINCKHCLNTIKICKEVKL